MQASAAGSCNSVGDFMEHSSGRRGSHGGEHFAVARETIGNGPGLDARTTLMIRNIPNKYTQKVNTRYSYVHLSCVLPRCVSVCCAHSQRDRGTEPCASRHISTDRAHPLHADGSATTLSAVRV